MKGLAVLAIAATLLPAAPAGAAEHLVAPADVRGALGDAGAQRARDLARLDAALRSPLAARAAALAGADLSTVRAALPSLSDDELRDLTARADALRSDPASGLSHDVEELLVIFLIVALVILVLKAA